MELPHIGQQCALKSCNKLDFLPIQCDSCSLVFCLEHYKYSQHDCPEAKQKDVQVPVCPLCSKPVPSKRNQLPDIAMSEHIDRFCTKNENLTEPIAEPTNLKKCSFGRCKQKDVIYLECNDCRRRFCVKHRYPDDHQCQRRSSKSRTTNKKHVQEKQEAKQSWMFTCLYITMLLVVVAIAVIYQTQARQNTKQVSHYMNLREESERFQNMWPMFREKYGTVLSREGLIKIRQAISKSVSRPGVILVLGSDDGTTSCVARGILKFVDNLTNSSIANHVIDVSRLEGSQIDEKFEETFKSGHFAIMLDRFESLTPSNINPVFTYTDEHNPKTVPAVIIIATYINGIPSIEMDEKRLSQFTEAYFMNQWSTWKEESAFSLLSRITSSVVNVVPRKGNRNIC